MARTQPELERTANLLVGALVLYWMGRGALCAIWAWRDASFDVLQSMGQGAESLHAGLPWLAVLSALTSGILIWRPADARVLISQLALAGSIVFLVLAVAPSLFLSGFGGLLRLVALGSITFALMEARRSMPRLGVIDRHLRLGIACWLLISGVIGWLAPADTEILLAGEIGAVGKGSLLVVQSVAGLEILAALALLVARPGKAVQTTVLWSGMIALSGIPLLLILFRPEAFWHPTTPHMAGFLPMACMAAVLFGDRSASLCRSRELEIILVRSRRIQALLSGLPKRSDSLRGIVDGVIQAVRSQSQVIDGAGRLSGVVTGRLLRLIPGASLVVARAQIQKLQTDLIRVVGKLPENDMQYLPLRSLSRQLTLNLRKAFRC